MLALWRAQTRLAKWSLRRFVATAAQAKIGEAFLADLRKEHKTTLTVIEKRIAQRQRLVLADEGADPADPEHIKRAKLLKELEPVQAAWDDWKRAKDALEATLPLLADPDMDMRSLASQEYESLCTSLSDIVKGVFPPLLVPQGQTVGMSALLELKAGVGGDEAALFVGDLYRMYVRAGQARGWAVETLSSSPLVAGSHGLRDAVLEVRGQGAYDMFRWESGVHRVQRVPETDSANRVHTSTASVITLPLQDEHDEGVTAQNILDEKDVKIEVMRARGAGGQHVNKTESAVRLTHIPTGITVSMQDDRSQHRNKAKAFRILRARLLDRHLTAETERRRSARRSIVKTSDRSDKIRTYNFPQDRITDHRIGLTIGNITDVLDGPGLDVLVDALQRAHDLAIVQEMAEEDNLDD